MSGRPTRRSLADSFRPAASPANRAAGLGTLLPPRPKAEPVPPPPVEGPDPVAAEPTATGPSRRAKRPAASDEPSRERAPRDDGPAANADAVRNVAVYLPVELLELLRRTARSRELTYADVLVEAAAAHLDQVAAQFAPVTGKTAVKGMPTRATRRQSTPGVQVQLRLDGHQVAWLEEQATQLGAPSRTALVAALLRAHLGSGG